MFLIYKCAFPISRGLGRRGWGGVGGGGGRGLRGGGGNFLYLAYYRRACPMAPFFSAARYMISPLISTKSIRMARFFWIPL